ncbi:glutathione peroxidase 6-like [Symsagittifera roscoffensis]|uniref:glutathione peroxidase 6-like n=1 Tax=Symsagittifera roscoffensis TaxID=84072 RepID=UPI00307B847F
MNAVQSEAENSSVAFTIIGFPCNQFGMQEPGANKTELLNLARYVRPGNNYQPNFPWFGPLDVNGVNEHPLFTYLKDICPPYQKNLGDRSDLFWDPVQSGDVTWNFEKYLIDTSGVPLARFAPIVTVRQIYEGYIVPNKQMMKKNRHANVKSVSY